MVIDLPDALSFFESPMALCFSCVPRQGFRLLRTIVYRQLLPVGLALLTFTSVLWLHITATTATTPPVPTSTEHIGDPKPVAPVEAKPLLELDQRRQRFIEADRLYLAGDRQAATAIYRSVKPEFSTTDDSSVPAPFTNPEQLSPGGRVFWREVQEGLARNLESRATVGSRLLVEREPGFIPGYIRRAEVLQKYGTKEEALDVLERGVALYPNEPDLTKAKVALLAEMEKWLEASIAARQFSTLNPDHPDALALAQQAEQNFRRFQGALQEQITGNTIAGILTGAFSYALTGSIFGPLNALQTLTFVLQGESSMGESIANEFRQQLEMVEDPEVTSYLDGIGQKLARLSGRNEFDYRFYIVNDPDLNAFALPGGKIFINAGAILKTNSEAELAGLLGHEISHAVLSHSFQIITQATLLGNLAQLFPLGNTLANLALLDYSRDMERQSDILGTRVLVSGNYAADGLRNLMVTMAKENPNAPISWLSTHPVSSDRVAYLEELIQRSSYNRFAFEGVERHSQIQARVKELLPEKIQDNRS